MLVGALMALTGYILASVYIIGLDDGFSAPAGIILAFGIISGGMLVTGGTLAVIHKNYSLNSVRPALPSPPCFLSW